MNRSEMYKYTNNLFAMAFLEYIEDYKIDFVKDNINPFHSMVKITYLRNGEVVIFSDIFKCNNYLRDIWDMLIVEGI